MARRRGKPGDYLITSDYSGTTQYASKVVVDYWGNVGLRREVLQRNLQEIAVPLNDPYPVQLYRGPDYEQTNACQFEILPTYIGKTNIPFPTNSAYAQLPMFDPNPGIGQGSVGCTFRVY